MIFFILFLKNHLLLLFQRFTFCTLNQVRFPSVRLFKKQPRRYDASNSNIALVATDNDGMGVTGNTMRQGQNTVIAHSAKGQIASRGNEDYYQYYPGINTPDSLRKLYNVEERHHYHRHRCDVNASSAFHRKHVHRAGKGSQACTGFLEQYFEKKDVQKFYDKFYPEATGREDLIKVKLRVHRTKLWT